MRLLILHVDRFEYTITEGGRSRLREPVTSQSHVLEEGLLALASVERTDADAPDQVAADAAAELAALAARLGTTRLVVHPFAHLFGDPAPPTVAVALLDDVAARLAARSLTVHRSPFGWFTRWDLQAKGHPLSRVGRTIAAKTPADEPAAP